MFYHVAQEKGFCTVDQIVTHANQNEKKLMPVETAVLYAEGADDQTTDSRIITFFRRHWDYALNGLSK